MKAVIYINNTPIHQIMQVSYKIEEFIVNRGIEVCENLTDADCFISVYPVGDKLVFCLDKTKLRGADHYIVDFSQSIKNCADCIYKFYPLNQKPCSECKNYSLYEKKQ